MYICHLVSRTGPDLSILDMIDEVDLTIDRRIALSVFSLWGVVSSNYPEDLMINQRGFAYVVDNGRYILKFDITSSSLFKIGIRVNKYT